LSTSSVQLDGEVFSHQMIIHKHNNYIDFEF